MKLVAKIVVGVTVAFILMIGGCVALFVPSMDDSTPEDKAAEIIEDAAEEEPADDEEPVKDKAPDMTTAQANAVRTAENYLDMSGFSEKGVIKQLQFEGYSKADASFAVKVLRPDWNEEAAESAQNYVDMSGFSRSGLIEQLMFEGYTRKQAEYGATQAGL